MTGLTYDSGALIAADRSERRMWLIHQKALKSGIRPVVPVGVLTEVYRSGRQSGDNAPYYHQNHCAGRAYGQKRRHVRRKHHNKPKRKTQPSAGICTQERRADDYGQQHK